MADANAISVPAAGLPPVRINAHAPVWRLVDALAAAGWGELRAAPQSVRSVLAALARVADARSGVASTTDAQLAERAGVHPRTVMRARAWLVDAGLVVVMRRGARQGVRGVASLLSISKRALVDLLPGARAAKDSRARERQAREGGAPSLAPNVTRRRPFPSLRRKTAPVRGRGAGRSAVQQELIDIAAAAAVSPPRAATIAAARAAIRRPRLAGEIS